MPRAPYWTPPEDQHLISLAGEVPSKLLHQHYNAWAEPNGLPTRTQRAIYQRLHCLGESSQPVGEWITSGTVSACLAINGKDVDRMFRRHNFHRERVGRLLYFTRRQLRAFAKRHPEEFGGFPHHRLVMLFEDERLADWILQHHPHRLRRCYRIYCPTLRQTFDTATDAARALYLSHGTIPLAIKQGRSMVAGIPFEVVP